MKTTISFIAILIILINYAFAQTDAKAYFMQGQQLYQQGDYFGAINAYDMAIINKRDYSDAYIERARIKLILHQYDASAADYSKALELKSEFANENDFALLAGLVEDNKGFTYAYSDCGSQSNSADNSMAKHDRVILCLDDKIFDTTFYNGHSFLRYLEGDFGKAEKDASALLKYDSLNVYAYYLLGNLSEKRGDFKNAINYYSSAISLDTTFYLPYYKRAVVFKKVGNFDAAFKDLVHAEKYNPNDAFIHYNKAVIQIKMEKWKSAETDLGKAIKLRTDIPEAYFNRAFARKQLKDFDGAMSDYNYFSQQRPKDAIVHNNKGNLFMLKSDFRSAIEEYKLAISIDPTLNLTYLNMGISYVLQGSNSEACDYFIKSGNLGNKKAIVKIKMYCN